MSRVFRFGEQYEMSNGVSARADVEEILLNNIPGAVAVRRAESDADHDGIDFWVDRTNDRAVSVDTKVREEDWQLRGEDDLALEMYSVVEKGLVGWTLNANKKTDYVLWLWKQTGRWAFLPFICLCEVFREHYEIWTSRYKIKQQNTEDRYHSQCVFVPRRIVLEAIEHRFGGDMAMAIRLFPGIAP